MYVRNNYHDGEDNADGCNAEYWGPVGETNDGLEGNTKGENCHREVQQTVHYVCKEWNAMHQMGFEPQIQILHM